MAEASIVVPVYNEADNLRELHRRLKDVFENILEISYEIIFIEDGSKDGSFEILKDLRQKDERIKIIKFSRNFGHHIAVTAGIDYASGNAVVLMDADLQDPPEEIPKLYKKFKEGYDIVYAVRKIRRDGFFKKLFSKLFYDIFRIFTNVNIPPDTGVFRIISREVAEVLGSCREKSRFVTGLISWTGLSSASVETKREARFYGKPKYSAFKSCELALDSIISFSSVPLKTGTYIGFFTALVSFVIGIYALIRKLIFGLTAPWYFFIMVLILFLVGLQLIIISALGEYTSRIYTEIQNRPMYVIKNKIGFSEKES